MELSEAETMRDVPVLQVSGEVDLATAAQLRDAADELIARRAGLVVIDLSQVSFLDSSGLKVLDEMQQRAADADGRIALVCPQQRIVRLLEITGLTDRFAIHSTPEGAADSENGGG
ncbi:STAS domain-containing protein [uncultured Jatrophihabitans sp.]|uniref:STAS domain-containing protein n=1 Tax=uncultured Jatrophihabitans sp. TaxID=1610747 RepID=UPI0035CB2FA8